MMNLLAAVMIMCSALIFADLANAEDKKSLSVEIRTTLQKGYDPSNHADTLVLVQLIPDRQVTGRCSLEQLSLHAETGYLFSFSNGVQILNASAGDSPFIRESVPAEIRFNPSVANRLCAGVPVEIELLKVRAKQFVPADLYLADIVLKSGTVPLSYAQLEIMVLPKVVLANGSSSLRETLIFPEAITGASARTSFAYLANTNVTLSAVSDNAGRLKNETEAIDAYLPYTLRLDGVPVDLKGGAELAMMSRTTGPTFVDVHFEIGAVSGPLWAGKYTDIVTISLSAY